MDKKINLSQLADLVAQAGGMSKTASEQFVKTFFDIIAQGVLADGMVKVKGLGTFKLLQMEDRESVNVNTGERFTIEGHQKISFSPDAELKERINKPFAAFETVEISAEQAAELAKLDETSQTTVQEEPVIEQKTEHNPEPVHEPESDSEVEAEPHPVVKDVTQKRFTRFILRLLIWILAIALVVPVLLYLFWPLVGCKILGLIDDKMGDKPAATTTVVADNDSLRITEIAKPAEPVKPAETVVKPAEPVKQTAKPAEQARPSEPATTVQTTQAALGQTVKLTATDAAKDLSQFTDADTLSYRITGELGTHVLQSGETLTKVALKYYGSKKLWPYIAKYNKYGKSYNNLKAGDKIRIPKLEGK